MKNMLVIEDDLLSQKIMHRIFKNEFKVDFCDSSEEYYANYSEITYDIIIVDISLKGAKNGLTIIKEIKNTSQYHGTPIICLTAHAQLKTRQTAIESGSDLFITKPVANSILREAVKFLIKS